MWIAWASRLEAAPGDINAWTELTGNAYVMEVVWAAFEEVETPVRLTPLTES